MADYFVASGGSNTAPYETWAKAATRLQTALTAATANGDRVIIQHNDIPTGDKEVTVDTTYTVASTRYIQILSASNDGGSAFTLTPMGTANWIGNSTTFRSILLGAGVDSRIYCYGLTLRTAGATLDSITLASGTGVSMMFTEGYLWMGNTSGIALTFGNNSGGLNKVFVANTTLRFGAVANSISNNSGMIEFINCTVSNAGSAPTTLTTGVNLKFTNCDLSFVTGTLVGNIGLAITNTFSNCKLGAGVTPLASQTTNPTASSASALIVDCSSGDTHGMFGYYDALGSVVSDTAIKYTGGAAAQSWKIVTTANATFLNPFETPWISLYNTGLTSITPRLEILRDGNATAFTDAEVWGEFTAKVTSGSTQATLYSDRATVTGTPVSQASGTDTWDGEGATRWSGKVDSNAAFTPAEVGDIRARVVVGLASTTLYVDPFIRT